MPIYPKRREAWSDDYIDQLVNRITDKAGGIRKYGPGKYSTILDSKIHEAGIVDHEIGSVDELGWQGLIEFKNPDEAAEFISNNLHGDQLTRGEVRKLLKTKLIVLGEGSQGFVSMDYFTYASEAQGRDMWDDIEKTYERYYEEQSDQG